MRRSFDKGFGAATSWIHPVEFLMLNSAFAIYSVLVYYSVFHLRYNTLNALNTNKSTKRPQRIDQLKNKNQSNIPKTA